jgi:hypothetical protein
MKNAKEFVMDHTTNDAYWEGYEAYMLENYGGESYKAINPYTGLDEDEFFEAWEDGYAWAGNPPKHARAGMDD